MLPDVPGWWCGRGDGDAWLHGDLEGVGFHGDLDGFVGMDHADLDLYWMGRIANTGGTRRLCPTTQ